MLKKQLVENLNFSKVLGANNAAALPAGKNNSELPNRQDVLECSLNEKRETLAKLKEVRDGNYKDLVETQKTNSSWYYSSWTALVSLATRGTLTHENEYDKVSATLIKKTESRIFKLEEEIAKFEIAQENIPGGKVQNVDKVKQVQSAVRTSEDLIRKLQFINKLSEAQKDGNLSAECVAFARELAEDLKNISNDKNARKELRESVVILTSALNTANKQEQGLINKTIENLTAVNLLLENKVTERLISYVQDKSIFRANNFGNFFYYDFLPVAGSIAVGVLFTMATGGAGTAGYLGVAVARSILLRGGLGLLATGVGGLVGGELVKETQYGLSGFSLVDKEVSVGKLKHFTRSLFLAWAQSTEMGGKEIGISDVTYNYSTQVATSSIGSGTSQFAGKWVGVGLGFIFNKLGGSKAANYLFPTFSQGVRNYIARALTSESAEYAGASVIAQAHRFTLKGLWKEVSEEFGEEGTEKIMEQGFAIAGTELKNNLGFSVGVSIPFVSPEAALLIGLRRSRYYGAYFNSKQEFNTMLADLSPDQQALVAQVLGEKVKLGTNTRREGNTLNSEIIDPELSKALVGAPRLVKAKEAGRALLKDENAYLAKNLSGTVLEYEGTNLAGDTKVTYRLWSEDSWKVLQQLSSSNIQALTVFSEDENQPHIINIPLVTNATLDQRADFLNALYEEQAHAVRGKDKTAAHEFTAKFYTEAKLKSQGFKSISAEEILANIINGYQNKPEEISQAVATYVSLVPDADKNFNQVLDKVVIEYFSDLEIIPQAIRVGVVEGNRVRELNFLAKDTADSEIDLYSPVVINEEIIRNNGLRRFFAADAQTETRGNIFSDRVAEAKKKRSSDADQTEQRQEFFQKLLANLEANLDSVTSNPNLELRSNQWGAIEKLIDFLEQNGYGGNNGFFRQPTGSGKTVLMGIVAKLLDVPTIILVPKVDLLEQTKSELMEMLGYDESEIGMVGNNVLELGRKITIATYGSHVSKMSGKSRDRAYIQQVAQCELVFCDEAHRSLGTETTKAIEDLEYDLDEDLKDEFDEDLTAQEVASEEAVLSALSKYIADGALILGVTATPKLASKHVKDYFRHEIHSTTYTEMVADKVNVPFEITEVEAEILADDSSRMTEEQEIKIIEREQIYLKELRAFAELLEKVEKGEVTFPIRGVGFCVNIAECDKFKEAADIVNAELEQAGKTVRINPEIVTSRECPQGIAGITQRKQAETRLRNQEINIIITVNKLAEGWNFKEANCALWARATRSVMLLVQGVGRVARSYQSETEGVKEKAHVIQARWQYSEGGGGRKSREGEPSGGEELPVGGEPSGGTKDPKGKREKWKPLTLQDALSEMGEDISSICTMANGSEVIVQEKYFKKTWDEGIVELAKFKQDNEDRLPNHGRDGSIGIWLGTQKQKWKQGKLSAAQIKQLEELGVKQANDKAEVKTWEERIVELAKFKQDNEGRLPIQSNGSLGAWLINQKQKWKQGKLSAAQIKQLEELRVEQAKDKDRAEVKTWEEGIVELNKFKQGNEGRLPTKSCDSIGRWLDYQKQKWKQGKLSAAQIKQLEALGVDRSKDKAEIERTWEEGIAELTKFKQDNEGRLPTGGGNSIGRWLGTQKQKWKQGKLSAAQIQQLEELGVKKPKNSSQ